MSINSLGNNKAERRTIDEILSLQKDRLILKALRDETAAIIVMARVAIEENKAERLAKLEEKKELMAELDYLEFGDRNKEDSKKESSECLPLSPQQ